MEWAVVPCYTGFGYDLDIEVLLCYATLGDSIDRPIKKQAFSISKGQYPDKALHLSDTGGVRVSVYEFYFDAPVNVKGTFLAGMRVMNKGDEVHCFSPSIRYPIPCIPGYEATMFDDTILVVGMATFWDMDME